MKVIFICVFTNKYPDSFRQIHYSALYSPVVYVEQVFVICYVLQHHTTAASGACTAVSLPVTRVFLVYHPYKVIKYLQKFTVVKCLKRVHHDIARQLLKITRFFS